MAAISLDIYHLIHRLSSTEKAYFKKFGYKYDKGEDRQELSLFDIIDKELKKVEEVEQGFEAHVQAAALKQLKLKSISKVKTNLYHDLLASLREYEKAKVIDEKIFENYQYAQILIKRNLFKEALSFLKKAESLAQDNELYELEIYINNQYAVLLSRLDSSKNGKESMQKLVDAIRQLKVLDEALAMEKHYFELVFLQKTKGVLNSPKDLEVLAKKSVLINEKELTTSAKGRLYQLESLSTIEILQGNQQGSFEYYEQIIELLDSHPYLKKINLQKYIILSEQYMQMSLLTMNISSFEEKHKAFVGIPCDNELEQSWKDNAEIFMLSIYAILNNQLETFDDLESRFNDLLHRIPYLVPGYRKISIAYYMVTGFFMRDEYDRSMDWYQFIQNNRNVGVRYDVDLASRIMMIIACFEKTEFTLMENNLKALRNFIANHSMYQLESILSSLFGKLLNETDPSKHLAIYELYFDKFEQHFAEHPNEQSFLGVFDIIAWLLAKISKDKFYTIWCKRNLQM